MAVITELKAIWIINLYDYCARAVSITVEKTGHRLTDGSFVCGEIHFHTAFLEFIGFEVSNEN